MANSRLTHQQQMGGQMGTVHNSLLGRLSESTCMTSESDSEAVSLPEEITITSIKQAS